MNPYEAPATPLINASQDSPSRPTGPFIIAILLIVSVVVGSLSTFIPSFRAFTMPRFGGIGLIICLNPLIFLLPWFWQPKRAALLASALMLFTIGVINAIQLNSHGTVSIVTNEFRDRLHSSWLWSVLSFFAAGVYLFWIAITTSSVSPMAIKGEQSGEPELPSTVSH